MESKKEDKRKSAEFREKCRQRMLGNKLSEITKQKLSESMKKNVQEGFMPRNIFMKGHKLNVGRKSSDYQKKIASETHKGNQYTEGRKQSPEEIAINSKFRKELWKNQEYNHPFKRPEVLEKIKLARIKRKQEGRYKQREESKEKNKIAQIEQMKNPENRERQRQGRLKQVFPVKDTKIEIKLQQELIKQNILFISHKTIIGQPDIFIEPNICIFADGNYWHNYPNGNERDKQITNKLQTQGYKVLRFWENEINENINNCISKIKELKGV